MVYDNSPSNPALRLIAENSKTRLLLEGKSHTDGHPVAYLYSLTRERMFSAGNLSINSIMGAPNKQITWRAS